MTPTMSEYFAAWKASRFVAGEDAEETAFVAASRLQDIADILGGLVLVYDNVEPTIAADDPQQAEQTGTELKELEQFAADLRDEEADGQASSRPSEADTLGSEAQDRAEAIAGQVSQAAGTARDQPGDLIIGPTTLRVRPPRARAHGAGRRAGAGHGGRRGAVARRRHDARRAVRRADGADRRLGGGRGA